MLTKTLSEQRWPRILILMSCFCTVHSYKLSCKVEKVELKFTKKKATNRIRYVCVQKVLKVAASYSEFLKAFVIQFLLRVKTD